MKKLLSSLTILALISPISMTTASVNAEAADPGMTPETQAKTQASVTISNKQGTFDIKSVKNLQFKPIDLELGKTEYSTPAKADYNEVELIVTDNRFGDVSYNVTAVLNGTTEEEMEAFPKDTEFKLTKTEVSPKGDPNVLITQPEVTEIFTLQVDNANGAEKIISAKREGKDFQGAGEWKILFEAGDLIIPNSTALRPEMKLGGIITWSMSVASN